MNGISSGNNQLILDFVRLKNPLINLCFYQDNKSIPFPTYYFWKDEFNTNARACVWQEESRVQWLDHQMKLSNFDTFFETWDDDTCGEWREFLLFAIDAFSSCCTVQDGTHFLDFASFVSWLNCFIPEMSFPQLHHHHTLPYAQQHTNNEINFKRGRKCCSSFQVIRLQIDSSLHLCPPSSGRRWRRNGCCYSCAAPPETLANTRKGRKKTKEKREKTKSYLETKREKKRRKRDSWKRSRCSLGFSYR